MGLWKAIKKTSRFSFVQMPIAWLGAHQLKLGNRYIADLWKTFSNPKCPNCNNGVLVIHSNTFETDNSDQTKTPRYLWQCHQCEFQIFAENDVKKLRKIVFEARTKHIQSELTTLQLDERAKITKGHQLQSRIYFTACLLVLIGFFYMIASGAAFIIALNYLAIAFVLFVFGIKKSYRYWQIQTGQLFIHNNFFYWFKNEKWFI